LNLPKQLKSSTEDASIETIINTLQNTNFSKNNNFIVHNGKNDALHIPKTGAGHLNVFRQTPQQFNKNMLEIFIYYAQETIIVFRDSLGGIIGFSHF